MKQKGKLKKIVIFCLCVIGITAATVLAVSKNSEEEVKNTFTYGEVKITLSEEKYDRLSNAAKVMAPLSKIDKDPVVVNTGKNDAVVFIKVEIPSFALIAAAIAWTLYSGYNFLAIINIPPQCHLLLYL